MGSITNGAPTLRVAVPNRKGLNLFTVGGTLFAVHHLPHAEYRLGRLRIARRDRFLVRPVARRGEDGNISHLRALQHKNKLGGRL